MGLEEQLPGGILLSTVEKVAGYVRKNSLWPATFGLACCAIEMMATAGPRFDIARFGMERFSATPRQADLMIVAGRVSQKMAPVLRQIYDQMAEPKWVLAMGVCASSGGMFNNYAIVQGVDHVVPVDIYLPGCPRARRCCCTQSSSCTRRFNRCRWASTGKPPSPKPSRRRCRPGPPSRCADCCDELARPGPREAIAQGDDEVIDVRRGMFRAAGTGDTSGYGRLVRTVTLPGSSPRPYGSYFDDVVDTLTESLQSNGIEFHQAIEKVVVYRDELTLHVDRAALPHVAQHLRDDPRLRFEMCLGVSGVHYPHETGRELHAVYPLQSITHNRRVRLEVAVPDGDPHIPSLYRIYPTTDWHERETYDFFGIVFDGHPSLTRIEMPDDWHGHPQRKDYPLGGIPVEYKGAQIPPPDERRAYN